MNIPNPDGGREICKDCGEWTFIAQTSTGPERLHCGTWEHRCHKPRGGKR